MFTVTFRLGLGLVIKRELINVLLGKAILMQSGVLCISLFLHSVDLASLSCSRVTNGALR